LSRSSFSFMCLILSGSRRPVGDRTRLEKMKGRF